MEKAIANSVYDKLAKSYNEKIDTKPHNAHYDRPAVQSLVPDVENKTVLDAGCGFCVIIMTVANSLVNKRVSELLPNFETDKIYGWCAA